MPLEIQVGKKYRTRSGDVVQIVEKKDGDGKALTLFKGFSLTRRFPAPQFYIITGAWGLQDTPYDLIEEITEPIKNGEG